MRTPSILAAALLLQVTSIHAANPCDTQNNTIEINACANQQFAEQDRLLNSAYQTLLKTLSPNKAAGATGDSPRAMLVAAQRRWIAFRDADCKAQQQVYAGGSIQTAVYLGCMKQRTEQRIKELQVKEWQGG